MNENDQKNREKMKKSLLLRTYVTSLLSLMLCVTMLLGTTYAWFTSEVTTGGNEIYVGTLKVGLTDKNGASLEEQTGLFGSGSVKWEPGATQIETVKVVNQGDLAFDYGLYLSSVGTGEPENLLTVGKYIDVYITTQNADANSAEEMKANWIRVGTLAEVVRNGYMLANGSCTTPASAEKPVVLDEIKIALHMPAEVSDPAIMGQKITNLGVRLMATQKVAESDDFGAGYDEAAPVDVVAEDYLQFAAAVNAGQSVRLGKDITIPENTTLTVASGKTVVIDMNGYDITGTSAGKGSNRELFLVKGQLIIKGEKTAVATAAEGETVEPYKSIISYTHAEADNMEWSNMTAIFDITAGGVVQLLDVKAVNNGGTDMNFVAHLNNWGTASLFMEGSHVEAPYCAIRVFNSGYDMNNVVAKNSTITSEKRAIWVHNYLGDLDSSKHTDEAIKNRLNISIFDGTNAITGEIRYGFADANTIIWATVDSNDELAAMLEKGAKSIELTLADGNYTMPEPNLQGKIVTIKGGKAAVIDVSAVDARDQFVTGTTLTFEGVTLNFGKVNYMGFANTKSLTYKGCAINGLQFLFGNSVTFENCVLNANGAEHTVWTYGAENISFTGCKFVYGDRGINCYSDNDITGGKQTVNFTDCTFTTDNAESKGAVEINSTFFSVGIEVNLTGCTAPAYGQMAYVSEWDSTNGAKTTINIK